MHRVFNVSFTQSVPYKFLVRLHSLHGMTVFSVLDLHRAFDHIPMEADDIWHMAIVRPVGFSV